MRDSRGVEQRELAEAAQHVRGEGGAARRGRGHSPLAADVPEDAAEISQQVSLRAGVHS